MENNLHDASIYINLKKRKKRKPDIGKSVDSVL